MIYFNSWELTADDCEVLARQHDNLTRSITVTGNLPPDWTWEMYVSAGGNMDILPMQQDETGLSVLLTAQNLPVAGEYAFELHGTQGEKTRSTNSIHVYIPPTMSGDAHWPKIPTAFTELEKRMQALANTYPIIGDNGNWVIADKDTGVSAKGLTPFIGDNGNWWIGDEDTGVLADPAELSKLTQQAQTAKSAAEGAAGAAAESAEAAQRSASNAGSAASAAADSASTAKTAQEEAAKSASAAAGSATAAQTAQTAAEAAQTKADADATATAEARQVVESAAEAEQGRVEAEQKREKAEIARENTVNQLKEDIADKLDKPANPVVGQVLRVKSIDETGKIVLDTTASSGSDSSQGSEIIKDIEIVETQGKFAKWVTGATSGGAESSVSWASHSQFISVTPGETLRISCMSAIACPGIVFYKTNTMSTASAIGYALENLGTGDPSSGSTNRYTYIDKDVVVPNGAFYAILNNADGTTGHEWKCQKVSYISGGNTGTVESEKLEKVEYENEQLSRRLINAEKHNDFTWETFDKAYFVFIHDDSREFITTAYNAFHAKGVPVSSAAIAPYLSNVHGGKTVKEWLDLIVADGGEVLCHYSYDLKDSDDDSLWYKYVVDAKREFERNGFKVRGMILAGSSTVNSAKGEKFCRKYFDYADKVGTSPQYNLGRKLMLAFDSLDAFKQRIDSCARTPGIYAFGFHGNRNDETWITEDSLKEIIDYISAKDNCEITTYSAVFDKIGTTVLEKRIAALENV